MPLSYLSKSPGIGGAIKSAPEDFLVEEIGTDGTVFEIDKPFSEPDEPGGARPGRFVHFILQKKDWSTSSAISEIAKRLRTTHRMFNVAGNKDKTAITTQLVSASGIRKEDVLSLDVKDMKINGAWTESERVHMGALLGNRFTIRVRDAVGSGDSGEKDSSVSRSRSEAVVSELKRSFPNYFGEQRFGSSRKNTYQIGVKLLKGEIEEAVRSFLFDSEGETHIEAKLARKELEESGNYASAMNTFPRHLRLERSMIAHLAKKHDDFSGALRELPRNNLLMFIHAVQSHLFNRSLSDRIGEGELELERGEYFCGESSGFPDISKAEAEGWITAKLIGYQTNLNEREKELLGELGLEKESFRMKSLPEINSKGSYRTLLAPMKDFNLSVDTSIVFRFSLPSGSYATVAMREFMKNDGN